MSGRTDSTPHPLRVVLDRLLEKAASKRPPSFRALVEAANLDPSCDFVGASLRDMDFRDDDLRGFDFSNADLTGADFRRANVDGVAFRGAVLKGTIGLSKGSSRVSRSRSAGGYVRQHGWQRQATIGFLGATKHSAWSEFVPPFEHRLRELGWIDGHNLHIDYRWANAESSRFGTIARQFVERGVDVIVTAGTLAVAAAKKATKTIPIVFAAAGDPAGTGLVHSLAHPGGNVTGVSDAQTELAAERLDLLRKAVPELRQLALIGNCADQNVQLEMEAVQKEARKLRIGTVTRDIRSEPQIASTMKSLRGKADALYVCADPFVTHYRVAINTLAAGAGLPTMHAFRHHAEAGGLMSYGPDFRDLFRDAADIVDKVLRGGNPADIPVKLEKKRELVVNLHTAKALGVTIPKGIRDRAEVVCA